MAPLFDTTKMSADEFQFIRLYCATVRREYHAVSAAVSLTDQSELGLTCPFAIAKLAIGLQGMYRECAHKLAEIGAKHLAPKTAQDCTPTLTPSLDDIGQIFTVSFFKIVDSATKSPIITTKHASKHDGWSSGRPVDWQHSIKSLYSIHKQKSPELSKLGFAFSKLFSLFMAAKFSATVFPKPYEDEEYDDYDDDSDDVDGYYFF